MFIRTISQIEIVLKRSIGAAGHDGKDYNKADKDNYLLFYRFQKQICTSYHFPHYMGKKDSDLNKEQDPDKAIFIKPVHYKIGEEHVNGSKNTPAGQLANPISRNKRSAHFTNLDGWVVNDFRKYTSGRYILQMEWDGPNKRNPSFELLPFRFVKH